MSMEHNEIQRIDYLLGGKQLLNEAEDNTHEDILEALARVQTTSKKMEELMVAGKYEEAFKEFGYLKSEVKTAENKMSKIMTTSAEKALHKFLVAR